MELEISKDGFIAALRTLEGGALIEELDRGLIECVQAIQERGGKAEIKLSIMVGRIPGTATAVSVSSDVVTKVPKEDRSSKVLFVTPGYGLTHQHQEQEEFDLGLPLVQKTAPLTPVSHIGVDNNVG